MDRRTILTGGGVLIAARALKVDAQARALTTSVLPDDDRFMQLAIDQAKLGDFPFGTVIVRAGEVVATGYNSGRREGDPTAHGEMVAIRNFLKSHKAEAFKDTTLYTSGEPCVMCMGAIVWCNIKRVVYAASIAQLATRIGQIDITSEQIANATPFREIEITGGVHATEAMALFPHKD